MIDLVLLPRLSEPARCAETDPEVFWPEPGQTGRARAAKMICRRCEARPECLRWALEHRIDGGVWGGLDNTQRRKILRDQAEKLRGDGPDQLAAAA